MLSKVVFFGLLVVVLSVAADEVPIISQASDIAPDGTYSFSYESGDGSKQEASGSVDGVAGSASYTDLDGVKHEFSYVADENGYQAKGADVPEIPAAIARALEWNAAHPEPEK